MLSFAVVVRCCRSLSIVSYPIFSSARRMEVFPETGRRIEPRPRAVAGNNDQHQDRRKIRQHRQELGGHFDSHALRVKLDDRNSTEQIRAEERTPRNSQECRKSANPAGVVPGTGSRSGLARPLPIRPLELMYTADAADSEWSRSTPLATGDGRPADFPAMWSGPGPRGRCLPLPVLVSRSGLEPGVAPRRASDESRKDFVVSGVCCPPTRRCSICAMRSWYS